MQISEQQLVDGLADAAVLRSYQNLDDSVVADHDLRNAELVLLAFLRGTSDPDLVELADRVQSLTKEGANAILERSYRAPEAV